MGRTLDFPITSYDIDISDETGAGLPAAIRQYASWAFNSKTYFTASYCRFDNGQPSIHNRHRYAYELTFLSSDDRLCFQLTHIP